MEPGASDFAEEWIAAAVATPGFLRKHQRRRFKEPDAPMFTLTSMDTHGVLVTRRGRGQNARFTLRDVATCLDASYHKGLDAHQMRTGVLVGARDWVQRENGVLLREPRIRRLTPRECWRLMGRTDEEFDRAKAAHVSETQLYKQAGNSVVPQVVTALGQRIVEESHSSRL